MSFLRNHLRLFKTRSSVLRTFQISASHSTTTTTDLSCFPGAQAPFVGLPKLTMPEDVAPIPIYRVMNKEGEIKDSSQDPNLSQGIVQKMLNSMLSLNTMDKILYESQRQGRISFYMTNFGEEATHIGSAAALKNNDLIYGQYREAGILVYRGFTIEQFIDQCYGNCDDIGKGKQMPVHYGSKDLNFVTISSPLATQMPQAVGAAYAFKREPNNNRCVVCFFGEGAASEGDSHAAFNFAATLDCPVILFCRNNGFAISTPSKEQYAGDGIAGRGPSYGIATIRVDGTDVFAVYNAMKIAREYVLKYNKPIVFEAMSYRISHHSTSDDSTAYRKAEELEIWNTVESPIHKLRNYMKSKGWWDEEAEKKFVNDTRKQILKQINVSEKKLKGYYGEMFHDVYDEIPKHLKEQLKELEDHVARNKQHYSLNEFKTK